MQYGSELQSLQKPDYLQVKFSSNVQRYCVRNYRISATMDMCARSSKTDLSLIIYVLGTSTTITNKVSPVGLNEIKPNITGGNE